MMQSQQQKGNPGLNVDRSARSIFVGNISYDVSEEELRKLLSACGQIVNFRLVHDRDTGRPKGFGFCEFVDVQMADTAIRNFNGYEIRGRQLRVDSATGNDRSADEVQQFQMTIARPQQQPPAQQQPAMPEENPYGPEPEAGKAPEAIARTVASMPPEKMFELMRSMKDTVNNNPQMARQLLIENPQLSYALLQAQVVMRVVDPKVAYSMLHREQAQPLVPQQQPPPQMGGMTGPPPSVVPPFQQGPPPQFSVPPPQMTQQTPQSQFSMPPPGVVPGPGGPQFHHNFPPPGMGMPPPRQPQPPPQHFGGQPPQQQHQTPMVQQMAPQQMPQQQSMVSSQSNDSLDEEQQAQMLVRVLQLTDEQIRMLPPTERAQVIELRNQLRNAGATA